MAEIIYNEAHGEWEYRQMLRSPYVDYGHGQFFITCQVHHNKSVFGAIVGERCALNELGLAVEAAWRRESDFVEGLQISDFVVMPNHFHALLEYHMPVATGPLRPVATGPLRPVATGPLRPVASPPLSARSIKYSRDPHAHDLPYVIGLFKSYTTHLYHRLKVANKCIDIGPRLWQASFYDELIRSKQHYQNVAHYIRLNPSNWNTDRFGAVTAYAEGNLGLLQSDYVAYLSSEGIATVSRGDRATAPGRCVVQPADTMLNSHNRTALEAAERSGSAATVATAPLPVISTFTSYYERQVLAQCLAKHRRVIWVCPGGIDQEALWQTAAARAAGEALLLSPVAPGTGVNKQRANWCNQFIVKNANSIWVGHLRPGGSLETILKALRPESLRSLQKPGFQ